MYNIVLGRVCVCVRACVCEGGVIVLAATSTSHINIDSLGVVYLVGKTPTLERCLFKLLQQFFLLK